MECEDVLVMVCCEDDVVDVQGERLESDVVIFIGRPSFGVDRSVPVA